jgi:hypothetical protein
VNPDEFIRYYSGALLRGTATVLCGAGLSKQSGLPLWDELMKDPARELGFSTKDVNDLALLAQYYVTSIPNGRSRLEKLIKRKLSRKVLPNINHNLIAQLPLSAVWTTNYDSLLEQACPKAKVCMRDKDLIDDPPSGYKIIYKMHGDLSDRIVITREDYEKYPLDFPRMWAQLVATFATESILFLGFGFNDPNVAHLLALARTQWKEFRRHFAIVKKPLRKVERLLHEYRMRDLESVGIHTIEVETFAEITTILRKLLIRVCPPRVFISGSYQNNSRNDHFCRQLGKVLAHNGIGVVSGANRPGTLVSYALGDALIKRRRYSPDELIFFWVSKPKKPIVPERRLGTIVYYGKNRRFMRMEILRRVRATVLIGGAEGTRKEAELSWKADVPVIPVAATGGAAFAIWAQMMKNLHKFSYGARVINRKTFQPLNSRQPKECLDAVVLLLKQAMFLDV